MIYCVVPKQGIPSVTINFIFDREYREMDSNTKLQQNLDTNFLKLVAIISMVIDHFGKIFFPENIVLGIIGRIAFPLFAYCIVVGCLHTSDFKKYILRLSVFAVVSQPFFNMAFHPTWEQFWQEFFVVNIFFTLIAGALAVKALMNIKRNWWMLLIAIAMEVFIGLDYGLYGITLMIIFYLCRNKNWLSALLAALWMMWNGLFGSYVTVLAIGLDQQFFAVLALPLIYVHTNFNPKIHKYFFYAFYPAHLLLLFIVRIFLGV
jgi:hypothetical protein